METVTRLQNPDEAVFISYGAITLGKGMNPTILTTPTEELVNICKQFIYVNICKQYVCLAQGKNCEAFKKYRTHVCSKDLRD